MMVDVGGVDSLVEARKRLFRGAVPQGIESEGNCAGDGNGRKEVSGFENE